MSDIQEIYNILLSRGYQEELFSTLPGERKRQGAETLAECPFCKKAGHFSYSSERPVWKCWSCSAGGDWLDYMEKRDGLDFRDALFKLADKAGVEVSGRDREAHKAYTKRADILEAAQAVFIEAMQDYRGDKARQYLEDRGYSTEDIKAMELGANIDPDELKKALYKQGYKAKDVQDTGLLSIPREYSVTMLWRDAAGRAVGIVGRSTLTEAELRGQPKYRYSKGMHKDDGLIGYSRARGSGQVILVEGVLDALYLSSKGIKAVAVGGTTLSSTQMKALEDAGTKEVLLSLDGDKAGQAGTERIIRSSLASRLRLYTVTIPAGYKDPDELVRAQGIQAFQDALLQAERWPAWMARYIAAKHDMSTARGQDQAIDEALKWYLDITDSIEQREYRKAILAELELTDDELDSRLRGHQAMHSTRMREASLSGIINRLKDKALEHDTIGAEEELSQGLQELRANRGMVALEPYLVEDFISDIETTEEGLKTGYLSLDRLMRIPQGALTIVAGRPGHGKTTMMLNLLTRMIRMYPSKEFYFFSYEEASKMLELKLLMNLAGVKLSRDTNTGAYINYIKEKRGTDPAIEQALKTLEEYSSSGRLWITDKRLSAEDLASSLAYLAGRDIGAVFIDYIQKVPLAKPLQSQRYLELKRVSELLLDQAITLDIPIVLGAQLSRQAGSGRDLRLEYLRESGDIEQDANLVIGLVNEAVADLDESGTVTFKDADIRVEILKQRTGVAGRDCYLAFDRPVLRIEDKGSGETDVF